MGKTESRSDQFSASTQAAWPRLAGLSLPVLAIAIIVLGMVLIALGVVNGALFVPGVWVLIAGFVVLMAVGVYGTVKEPV